MTEHGFVSEDLVRIRRADNGRILVLAWGDPVEVLGYSNGRTRVRVGGRGDAPVEGTVKGKLPVRKEGVFQLALVDVQQGDGMVLQTPQGKILFVDGGDNKLFARYTASRFSGSTADAPQVVEAMVITHGDADHFLGLNEIVKSEAHKVARKRLFIRPKRIFHNGLVKGSSKLPPEKVFGRTVPTEDGHVIVDLAGDLRQVSATRMNVPYRQWTRAIEHWAQRGPIAVSRLRLGDSQAFDFLQDEGIAVEVHGPIPETVSSNGGTVEGLPLLHEPSKTLEADAPPKKRAYSTAHTINGHSVVLRFTYGNVRMLLAGDLNQESMQALRERIPTKQLEAEIVKVPHHGSADFDFSALKAMAGTVWLISSGDESSRKEYIHPRATLMGALGRASRGDTSLVFCTELAAFFAVRGPSITTATKRNYFGFERTSFGIVHVRTDGQRVLVFTHSGREELKEVYRFTVDAQHRTRFAPQVVMR